MSDYFSPENFIDFVSPNDLENDGLESLQTYRSTEVAEFSDHYNRSSIDIPYETTVFQGASSSSCPVKPMILSRTHFVIETAKANEMCGSRSDRFRTMTRTISAYLSCFSPQYDFSFLAPVDGPHMWKGKYIQGSVSCEIEVNIYSGDAPNSYIVEACRMTGEAKPFHSFYKEFKRLVTNGPEQEERGNMSHFSSLDVQKQTKEQFLHSVRSIFIMCTSEYFDSRLQATKMLCDLLCQQQNEHLQCHEFVQACMMCLEKLMVDAFEEVRQHAIIAFACLKDIPGYLSHMVRSKALPIIFSMLESAPEPMYDTIQVRRECACILACLAQFEPRAVMENLHSESNGKKVVHAWKVENLARDATLHNYALRARECLLRSVPSSDKKILV